ncbi:uroporphyrinogen-III synthase [Wenyingzhuangia sp. IMCC45533]
MKILSTKKLTETQLNLLQGFEVDEVPMIKISYGSNFKVDEWVSNAIFTSANSVKSVFEIHQNNTDWFDRVYCVGNKTQYLLEKQGLKVDFVANNGVELAEFLAHHFSSKAEELKQVNWFCGNLRNEELPTILAENGIMVTKYLVYQTELISRKLEKKYDAILFYSPSGIKSYIKENKVTEVPVICIGVTTATEAINHFKNVFIAEDTSVESVIKKAMEVLSNQVIV